MRYTKVLLGSALFFAGLACGGYLFDESIPRSFLALADCDGRCYKPSELAGLIASAAILRAPFAVPRVAMESDTCVAIRHPKPEARLHYVLFPKHDTRNITTMTEQDSPFVLGCFAMARELVARDNMRGWRLVTNGPGLQDVAYLHFHLVGH
ncbi:MAG TPA: HIT domain-containing protein [Burkholderiaceae bacterium]|nr:HIT domain-containing protein [Burkholderiaceae bacterium]